MGTASGTTSFGAMGLYYLASLDRHERRDSEGAEQAPLSHIKSFLFRDMFYILRRENRSLAIFALWGAAIEASVAIAEFHSDADGNHLAGWFVISMIFWINLPLLYFAMRVRDILSLMSPPDILSYLSINILTIGISSLAPMMYLSMDTIKCASNALSTADDHENILSQCSGVLYPQASICFFLLVIMVVKVIVAPLSTTSFTTVDFIKLDLPLRFVIQGVLASTSFALNFYLFANMAEGKSTDTNLILSIAAVVCIATPLFIEFFLMVINLGHHSTIRRLSTSGEASDLSANLLGANDPADGGLAQFM
ncbi:hypothetical protein TrRE_jg7025 [Triparma retinervis]|uniref:Uncharacterized protein n=1 Tax=Triparma retinervis TaxID=2557542 RepID=A0A9W7A6W1_9STRA|nr:hypothetical protein TrRE_jg7025 [Triparma retinervis]